MTIEASIKETSSREIIMFALICLTRESKPFISLIKILSRVKLESVVCIKAFENETSMKTESLINPLELTNKLSDFFVLFMMLSFCALNSKTSSVEKILFKTDLNITNESTIEELHNFKINKLLSIVEYSILICLASKFV